MKERLNLPAGVEGFVLRASAPLVQRASHRHDELEVNVVVSGRAAYLFGQERVSLQQGSMIWLFPEQEHVLIDWSADFSMWILVFTPRLVREHSSHPSRSILGRGHPGAVHCRNLAPSPVGALETIYRHVDMSCRAGDRDFANVALTHALLASWQEFQFSDELAVLYDVHPAVTRAVQALLSSDEVLTLDQMARKAGMSRWRLSRLFKQHTGTTLTAFRQRHCFERFLKIYRQGGRYTLTEAALKAGFGSYPQFHRIFVRLMGKSPAAYARSVKRNPALQ